MLTVAADPLMPAWRDATPPCSAKCYLRNDWPILLQRVQDGNLDGAALHLLKTNPFPSTLGRVCPHPCESGCNRDHSGGSIRLPLLERFLGDHALHRELVPEATRPRYEPVAVVGAGPAGLSAAWFLRRLGHPVDVYEKEDRPGGLLWGGIPPYRLPRHILKGEADRLRRVGVRIHYGSALGRDFTLPDLMDENAAVVVAVGLARSRTLGLQGDVLDGASFLRRVHRGEHVVTGHRVAVVGGGNSALDCARTLVRQGKDVTLLYRRTRAEMPAFEIEVEEALEEGVRMEFLSLPVEVLPNGLRCVRMRLGARDADGRARPQPIPGSEFDLPVETVVCALGDMVDPGDVRSLDPGDTIPVDERLRTRMPHVYACGDCSGTGGTVGRSVRAGRDVAAEVHAAITGLPHRHGMDPVAARGATSRVARARQQEPVEPPVLHPVAPARRVTNFYEIWPGLDRSAALREAERCFKCGTCIECDVCRHACLAEAIRPQRGLGYDIDPSRCTGCGACATECPRGALEWAATHV